VDAARRRFLSGATDTQEFEAELEAVLEGRQHADVEVHIWGDPPPGHAIHLHFS
jgi:hypothetical protein